METQKQTTHPSRLHLAALALGKLRADRKAELQKHVASCSTCSDYLSNTPRETFVSLFREAQARASEQSTPGIRDAGTLIGVPSPNPLRNDADQAKIEQKSLLSGAPPKDSVQSQLADIEIPPELREQTKYRVIRLLGRGGMGSVYKAQHERMDRLVAIKTINPSLVDHPEALKRFDQEVMAAARLDHANVARAYDADQFGSLCVLVMEFVPGQSLDQLLATRGKLEVFEACRLVRQAMIGLQHAHERGMVHRDLKPQNLMLTPDGKVKILDFGLAKIASERRAGKGLTRENALMGTPHYLAPEQALDAAQADIRADIYSLGCTLYCLLTGEPPFNGDTEMKVLLAHQNEKPRPLCEIRPDVPKALSDLVDRMLAKKPDDRPQTPAEVARALAPFVKGPAADVSPETEPGLSELTQQSVELPAPPAKAPVDTQSRPLDDVKDENDAAQAPSGDERPSTLARLQTGLQQLPGGARLWAGGVAVALLSLFFIAWLAGVFTLRTQHGTIIVENVPADVDVLVDGNKVTLKRDDEVVTIAAAPVGKHKLELTRDGKTIRADDVTIEFAGEEVRSTITSLPDDNDLPEVEEVTAESGLHGAASEKFRDAQVFVGDWKIDGDELVQPDKVQLGALGFGDPNWKDYNFRLKVKAGVLRNGYIGIVFNAKTETDIRIFRMGTLNVNTRGIWRLHGLNQQEVTKDEWIALERDRWYDVLVEVRGSHCKCSVDDVLVCEDNDESCSIGKVGLGTLWCDARFKDIKITTPDDQIILWEGLPNIVSTPKEGGRVQLAPAWNRDNEKSSVSPHYEPPKDARKIDLLKLIDIEKDQVVGGWAKRGESLTSSGMIGDVPSRIEIPFSPSEEYDVRIELVRMEGKDGIGLICLADSKQFMAVVGTWGNAYAGIATLNGVLANKNESGARSPKGWLTNGNRHELVVKVRRSGVSLLLDGVEISQAAAPYSRFGLDSLVQLHHQDRLGLSSCSIFEIQKIELFEITGEGEVLRDSAAEESPVSAPKSSSDQAVFPAGDIFRGDWEVEGEEIVQSSLTDKPAVLVFGDPAWSFYNIEAKAKSETSAEGFQVLFNWSDQNHFRGFAPGAYGNTYSEMLSVFGGKWDKEKRVGARGKIEKDRWYQVRLEVRGAKASCLVDGVAWFENSDDRLVHGRVGFRTWGTSARFKDVKITSEDGKTALWEGLPELP